MISDTLFTVTKYLNALSVEFQTLRFYKTKHLSHPNRAVNRHSFTYENCTATPLILCGLHLALLFASIAKYLNLSDTHAEESPQIPLLVGTAIHHIENLLNYKKYSNHLMSLKGNTGHRIKYTGKNLKLNGANHEKRCYSSLPKITSNIRT